MTAEFCESLKAPPTNQPSSRAMQLPLLLYIMCVHTMCTMCTVMSVLVHISQDRKTIQNTFITMICTAMNVQCAHLNVYNFKTENSAHYMSWSMVVRLHKNVLNVHIL